MARTPLTGRKPGAPLPGPRGVMALFFDKYGVVPQYVGKDDLKGEAEAKIDSQVWWNLTSLTQRFTPIGAGKAVTLKPGDCVIGAEFVRMGPEYGGPLTLGDRVEDEKEVEVDGRKERVAVFKEHVIPAASSIKVDSRIDAAYFKSRATPGKQRAPSGDRGAKRAAQIDLGKHAGVLEPKALET
jgi:hypothetical protein